MCVCVCVFVGVKKREGEGDVATETGGGLISVIKAEDRWTHTHAGHGLTNHSVPQHFVFAFLRVSHWSSPTEYH